MLILFLRIDCIAGDGSRLDIVATPSPFQCMQARPSLQPESKHSACTL